MKEGWEYKKLGNVCDIFGRIGFRGYTKSDLVKTPKEGAITLSPSNIINGEMNYDKCSYISWAKYEESPEIKIKIGDILLVKTASVGKTAIVKSLPHEATINPQFVVFKNIKIDNYYLSYFLKSQIAQQFIWSIAKGAAAQTVSQKNLSELQVPIPPLSEQQQIVEYLDAQFKRIDALKANAEQQLQAAKDLFQAALKEMLTPKEGWVEKKLGELCHIVGGGTPSKRESKYYGGNIPWASIRDMNFDILSETELCITNEGLKNSTSHLINKGEIVIATRVGLGKVCILAQDTAINQDIKGIIPKKENIDRLFMFYFFKKNAKFIEENGVGATVKGVKIQFIENLSFPMIKISEQQHIADRLDALSANVKALQTNYTETITLCNDLKQALLKKVFG